MSDFFSDLESAVKRVASSVSSEVTLAAREQKVREAFQTLGRMYYKSIQSGEGAETSELTQQVQKIETLLQEIDELRANQKMPNNE